MFAPVVEGFREFLLAVQAESIEDALRQCKGALEVFGFDPLEEVEVFDTKNALIGDGLQIFVTVSRHTPDRDQNHYFVESVTSKPVPPSLNRR